MVFLSKDILNFEKEKKMLDTHKKKNCFYTIVYIFILGHINISELTQFQLPVTLIHTGMGEIIHFAVYIQAFEPKSNRVKKQPFSQFPIYKSL